MPRRKLVGKVVSIKNQTQNTIVVEVEKKSRHPLYEKVVKKYKKYHVHSEGSNCILGDVVTIIESSPISKNKKWRLVS